MWNYCSDLQLQGNSLYRLNMDIHISLDLLSQVDQAYRRGDIVAARSASEKAKKWSYFGVLCGVMEFILMAAVWLVILYGFWKIQQ